MAQLKKCVTCNVLVVGEVEQLEHWLAPNHQERSLEEFRRWGQAEKKKAVILFFILPVELRNLMANVKKKFAHFDQLTNLFKTPRSKKGEVIFQFKECSSLDNIWNPDGKIFEELFWDNIGAVHRLSELPDWKWNLLLEPEISENDFMTHDQINGLSDRMAIKILEKLCSYWDWPPPIYEVKTFKKKKIVIDTLTVNGKRYQTENLMSCSYITRRELLAKRCLFELQAIPSQEILMDCDDYVKKLRKLVAAKQWKISEFMQYHCKHVLAVGDTYYLYVSVNGIEYRSPVAAPIQDEAENLAAFQCLQRLKRLPPRPLTLEPLIRSAKEPVKNSNSMQQRNQLEAKTQQKTFNCMTVPEIQTMDGNLAILLLRKLCSLRNWAPPIYEGREMGEGLIIFDVRVNGTLYRNLESLRHPWPNCLKQRILTTKSCLMQLSDVPRNAALLSCDDEVTKLKKFVERKKWQLPIYRESYTPPPGSLHYIYVTVNEMEYISVFGGFTKEEGENFAAFYCLQELQNYNITYPHPTPLLSPWDVPPPCHPPLVLNFNIGANRFQQKPYFPRVAQAPFSSFMGPREPRNNFRLNQQTATEPQQAPVRKPTRPARPHAPVLSAIQPYEKRNLLLEPSEPSAPSTTTKARESAPKASMSTCTSSIQLSDPRLKVVQTERGDVSSSGITHDQINGLSDRMAIKILEKLCSYWDWQPPIYEVKKTTKKMVIDTLTVNGKRYQRENWKSGSYFIRRELLAKRCLLELKAIPSQEILMDCDDYVIKLRKFVAAKQWKISKFRQCRCESVASVGNAYYFSVEVNDIKYESPVAASEKDEAQSLTAFHCLEKLKKLRGPSKPTSKPISAEQPPPRPDLFSDWYAPTLPRGSQHQYVPRVASELSPGSTGSRSNFSSNQPAPAPNPTQPQVIQTPAKSKETKIDDAEIAVVRETKKPEAYISDDSDIKDKEVTVVKLIKSQHSTGGINNVKTERSETPWEITHLPSDYVAVSGGQGEETRYAFKLTVNRCHYQNERVERTEEKAKEKVTRLCLQELCHLGQIPHPSVFWNVPLDPVRRLANLAECRLGDDKKHEPQYFLTHDSVEDKYSIEVIYNGIRHKDVGAVTYASADEAKRAAALFCLKELSNSTPGFNWTFAHGSVTAKARDKLPDILPFEFSAVGNRNRMQKIVTEEMTKILSNCLNDNLVVKIHVTMLKDHFHAQLPQLGQLTLSCFNSAHLAELDIHVFMSRSDVSENGTIDPEQLENSILSAEGNMWFPNVRAIRRPEEREGEPLRKKRRISNSTCRFELPRTVTIGVTLHMDRKRVEELEMHQFTKYIATFDARVSPLVALIRHWAKVNNLRFSPSLGQQQTISEGLTSVIPDFALLDWLVLCFLARLKIIPAPRDILQRPRKNGQPHSIAFFNTDEEFVETWRTTIPNAAAPPADKSIDALSPEITTLAQKFFHYYGESLSEGSWILNTRDAELIFTLDFLKGSFMTDLTPEDLKNIRDMMVRNGTKLIDPNCKLIVLHPTLNTNWRIVLDVEMASNAQHIFTAMQTAAVKLKSIVQHLQKESDAETEDGSLPDFNF